MPWPKGRPRDAETKLKLSQAMSGRPKTDDQRSRIAAGCAAFWASEAGARRRAALSELNRGANHPQWKETVGYKAAHYRVRAARGAPTACEDCGATGSAAHLEWANLTGDYQDPMDYKPLCKSCHNAFDGIVANLRG